MKTLVAFLLLGSLGLTWCCSPKPGAINVARNGEASQSSTYGQPKMGQADNAIDGVKDSRWGGQSCTHTNADRGSWWKLDMKQRYKVNVVAITGRSDCCSERLRGAEVRIGDSPDNNNPVCGKISSFSNPITFCCNGMEGQYLSIVIVGRSEYLTLCEVEVYGDPVSEVHHVCW